MPVHVHGIIVVVGKVPAAGVVDVAIGVIVNAISRYFAGVTVNVSGKLGVVVVNAGVDDGDHYAVVARAVIPGFRGVDVSVDQAPGLAGVVQSPQLAEVRIVGEEGGCDDVIEFAELNQGGA